MIENDDLTSRIDERRQLANEAALLDSIPPINPSDIFEIEQGIAGLSTFVEQLRLRPFLRKKIVETTKAIVESAPSTGRLTVWPWWPKPWPWPPIILHEPPIATDEELAALADRFVQDGGSALGEKSARGARILVALGAGILLGQVCGTIYKKYFRSQEEGGPEMQTIQAKLEFATGYMSTITLNGAQVAAFTRSDYDAAISAIVPAVQQQLSIGSVALEIDRLAADVGDGERILPAVVFAVGFVLGFISEAR